MARFFNTAGPCDPRLHYTGGQPWLVNALARQAVQAAEGKAEIGPKEIESAKEALILRRDTHLDSLIDRLREPRVRRILEPILAVTFSPPRCWMTTSLSSAIWAW